MGKKGSTRWFYTSTDTEYNCYICEKTLGTARHHLTAIANGGEDNDKNVVYLCNKHHDEFEGASWEKLYRARRTYIRDQQKLRCIKQFRSPEGHSVEWSMEHQEFREWILIPGGLISSPYRGPVPESGTE